MSDEVEQERIYLKINCFFFGLFLFVSTVEAASMGNHDRKVI